MPEELTSSDGATATSPQSNSAAAGPPFTRSLPWLLLLGGLVGAVAAFVLTVEKIALLKDPDYVPSCSISPLLSCGSVMRTEQAEVFGFPNSLLGVAAFPVVAALGAILLGRAQLAGWVWRGLLLGTVLGAGFVHWLIFQSVYRIGALCPYCMVVWAVTIPIFWYVLLHVAGRTQRARGGRSRLLQAAVRNHAIVLTAWYLAVAAVILHQFWDYWSTLGPGA